MSVTFSWTLGHLAHLSSLTTSSPSSSSPAADWESHHRTQRPLPFQMALHCHGNCLMYAFATPPLEASSPALRWVKTLCGYMAPPPLHIHTHRAKREEGKLNFTHYFMHHSHCWQHGWRPMRILKCDDAPFFIFLCNGFCHFIPMGTFRSSVVRHQGFPHCLQESSVAVSSAFKLFNLSPHHTLAY